MSTLAQFRRQFLLLAVLIVGGCMLCPTAAAGVAGRLPTAFVSLHGALRGSQQPKNQGCSTPGLRFGAHDCSWPRGLARAVPLAGSRAEQQNRRRRSIQLMALRSVAAPLLRVSIRGLGRSHSNLAGTTLQSLLSQQANGRNLVPRAQESVSLPEDYTFAPVAEGWATVGPVPSGWGERVGVEEESALPEHPHLLRGALPNGLRYSILSSKVPANRVYTNLEGRLPRALFPRLTGREARGQGLAHFLEHMLFLGSDKYPSPDEMRQVLGRLGMSQLADANAYTDFRSTVYTLSAPTKGVEKHRPQDNVMAARRDTLFRAGLVATPATIKTSFEEARDDEEDQEDGENEEGDREGDNVSSSLTVQPGGSAAGIDAETESNVGLLLELLHQMCFCALIREADVDRERFAVLNEMRDTRDIDDKVATRYYEQMFPETLLPARFPIGKEDQVKRFTREDLVRFYKRHYYPSNMHLFVVGDVVPTEVLAEIERLFGPEPVAPPSLVAEQGPAGEMLRRGWQTPDGPISTWPKRGSIITHDWARAPSRPFEKVQHAQLSTFSLTVTTKEHLDSNVRARHLEEELIDSLIGMALDSRATERVNAEGDPPLSSIDWFYLNSPREVKALAEELGRIVQYGLAPTELDRLTKTLLRQYQQDAEKDETEVSEEKLSHLIDCAESGDAFMSAQQRFDLLQKISPSLLLEQVNARAASLYGFGCLGEGAAILVCAPDSEEMKGCDEGAVRALMRQGLQGLRPYEDSGELPEWLLPDGEMGRALAQVGGEKDALVSRQVDKQHGITQLRLANGVRVSLKQTKFDAKEAYISVFAVGGRCGEGHVEGIKTGAVVLGMQSALQSGLGPYGPNVVNRYCQLHEIDFDGGSSSEKLALEISASTSEADAMRRAFEVAHLFLRAPSIDDAALERVKRDSVVRHEANQRSLEALTSITLLKMLAHPSARAEPDPRMTVITPEVIDKLDREDLLSALRAELTPENLEVVVIGDFEDPAAVEALAVQHLAPLEGVPRAWDDDELFANMFHVALREKPATARVLVPEDSERSFVTMAFSTVNRWGVKGHARDTFEEFPGGEAAFDACMSRHGSMFVSRSLALAQDVLNNRLYEGIRERGGLVYSIGIEWEPYQYMDAGFFSITLAPMPEKQDVAIEKRWKDVLSMLHAGGADGPYSRLVHKNPTLAEIRESLENNNYWISLMEGLQSDTALPKTKESITDIYKRYESLTIEEVMGVSRAVFKGFENRLVVSKGLSGPNVTAPSVDVDLGIKVPGAYQY